MSALLWLCLLSGLVACGLLWYVMKCEQRNPIGHYTARGRRERKSIEAMRRRAGG